MHVVVFDALHAHRLEGSGAHVQGDERGLHALGGNGLQQRLVEMQAGSRRGYGAQALGVDRLITLAVGPLIRAVYIRRQRHMADALQQGQHFLGETQFEQGVVAGQHLGLATALDEDLPSMRIFEPGLGDLLERTCASTR